MTHLKIGNTKGGVGPVMPPLVMLPPLVTQPLPDRNKEDAGTVSGKGIGMGDNSMTKEMVSFHDHYH